MKIRLIKSSLVLILTLVIIVAPQINAFSFGFFAHRKINRMALFTLPAEMVGFFKNHIEYLTEQSIQPDKLAHAIPGEAPRHYIDIDHFGDDPFEVVPKHWNDAVEKFTEDTLQEHGVLPWHINIMMYRLTAAFESGNIDRILYNTAHIGHYVADACTPLHTTKHYNGRTPDERGIHALWESRLPELYADDFSYFVGKAEYLENPMERAWELVEISHLKVDTIYDVFTRLREEFSDDRIFSHESRGRSNMRVFSRDFSKAFNDEMDDMVARQMRLAVKSVGDFWYTAWVNAGQPNLSKLGDKISESHIKELEEQRKEIQESDSNKDDRHDDF
ncbi:MAG: zinc dependent phospholipase C family protein [Bacteroidales bacterium]